MATDGRFGLPLIRNDGMKQKKVFSGGFVRLLRDHNHYETGLNKSIRFGVWKGVFGLQMEQEMATDGRIGLLLIRKDALMEKKLFLGGFVGQLRDHNHYETG